MRPAALLACLPSSPARSPAPAGDDGKARSFTHDLKPGGVAEECLRLEAGRSRVFEWKSDGPVDFNIHYHHGDKVTYPVKANTRRRARAASPPGRTRTTAGCGPPAPDRGSTRDVSAPRYESGHRSNVHE